MDLLLLLLSLLFFLRNHTCFGGMVKHHKSSESFAFGFIRMLLGIVHDEIDMVGIFNEPQLVTLQALTTYNVPDACA